VDHRASNENKNCSFNFILYLYETKYSLHKWKTVNVDCKTKYMLRSKREIETNNKENGE
jgi:hypothetical protein